LGTWLRARLGDYLPDKVRRAAHRTRFAEAIEIAGQECIIAILRDITERKFLEKQLRQTQKMEAVGSSPEESRTILTICWA